MRKKEKMIQEAFKIYQLEESNAAEEADDFYSDYSEGIEDRIFYCIEKMHIRNPRRKAKIICIASMTIVVCCLLVGFLVYSQSRTEIRTTQHLNRLWKEAEKRNATMKTCYIWDTVDMQGVAYQYRTIRLPEDLSKKLETYDIPCTETEKGIKDKRKLDNGVQDNFVMICYVSEEAEKADRIFDDNKVYELSGRTSKNYLLLYDESQQCWGLAKYKGLSKTCSTENLPDSKEIFEKIYGVQSAADIRSITLERYQARSKENPERLLSVYTKDGEKKGFLSCLKNENQIMAMIPESAIEEEEPEVSESVSENEEQEEATQDLQADIQKTWEEVTKEDPDNCYWLTFENKFQESFRMGILLKGDGIWVFMDPDVSGEIHLLHMLPAEKKWLHDVVKEADKVY